MKKMLISGITDQDGSYLAGCSKSSSSKAAESPVAEVEVKVEQRSDFFHLSLSRNLPITLGDFFSILVAAGAHLNESANACAVPPPLTPMETDAKTLKRNGFENQPEWSKTCELHAICFHIPQETRT